MLTNALEQVQREVDSCHRCDDLLNTFKAPRVRQGLSSKASVFIVGQALAASTQRESGVPYFSKNGKLGKTGEQLNCLLEKLGCTIFPKQPVKIGNEQIPHAEEGNPVYCSEILQCYPGRTGSGDRFPSKAVKNCLRAGFLEREIKLVDPGIILLLGAKTFTAFWRHFIKILPNQDGLEKGLSDTIEKITYARALPVRNIAGRKRAILPIIHPSGQTTASYQKKILQNDILIDLILKNLGERK